MKWCLLSTRCRKKTANTAANSISAPRIIWYTDAVTDSRPAGAIGGGSGGVWGTHLGGRRPSPTDGPGWRGLAWAAGEDRGPAGAAQTRGRSGKAPKATAGLSNRKGAPPMFMRIVATRSKKEGMDSSSVSRRLPDCTAGCDGVPSCGAVAARRCGLWGGGSA